MNQTLKTISVLGVAGLIGSIIVFGLGNALLPLVIAFILAYLTLPPIKALERRGIHRGVAVAGVVLIGISILALVIILVGPNLVEDARTFLKQLPHNYAIAAERIENLAARFGYTIDLSRQGLKDLMAEHASAISGDFIKSSSNILKGFFGNVIQALLFILNLLLIPLFFFHLVNHYEDIIDTTHDLVPFSWRSKVAEYNKLTNTVLSGYIRGQMLVCMLLAALYGFGFWIIGLKFGLLIGIVTGLLSIIPFVGSIIGFVTAVVVALANFADFGQLISVVVVFAIVQGMEGLLITPKLVGNKVGLGILPTMLALIIGGNIFGFVGMIIAIPLAAILKTVLLDLRQEYQSLRVYRGT